MTIDRTGLEIFWRCRRAFYWARRYPNGTKYPGLQSADVDYQIFGKAVHLMVEKTAGGLTAPIGTVVEQLMVDMADLPAPVVHEYVALLTGMATLWQNHVLPGLLDVMEIVSVEEELPVTIQPNVTVLVKPDIIFKTKKGAPGFVTFDWKSTSFGPSPDDHHYWSHAPQIQLGIMAVAQKYGSCDGAVVGMFNKGTVRNGQRSSPFCYGYQKGQTVIPEYKAGWTRTPVFNILTTHDWSMQEWINKFSPEQFEKLFWVTGLLTPSPYVVQLLKEGDYGSVIYQSKDWFPPSLSACVPASPFQGPCQFHPLCHTPAGEHPMTLYKARIPHHQMELGDL